jgi:hypothetical protein
MRRDKSKSVVFLKISLGAHLLGLFIVGVASAQTSFFQGKTVTVVQSSAPGGVGDMRKLYKSKGEWGQIFSLWHCARHVPAHA